MDQNQNHGVGQNQGMNAFFPLNLEVMNALLGANLRKRNNVYQNMRTVRGSLRMFVSKLHTVVALLGTGGAAISNLSSQQSSDPHWCNVNVQHNSGMH